MGLLVLVPLLRLDDRLVAALLARSRLRHGVNPHVVDVAVQRLDELAVLIAALVVGDGKAFRI